MRFWITLSGYLVIFGMGILVWIASKVKPETIAPLSGLVDRLMHERNMRLVLVAVWWWLGWHFYTDPTLTSLIL